MKYNIYVCMICNEKCHCIGKHVVKHGITPKEYYDTYLKKPDEGICSVCGKETPFKKISQGYASHCSFEHYKISDTVKEHRRATNVIKFGVENCFQSAACMQKARNTKEERYGDPLYRNDTQIKKTCLEKYGFENPAQSEIVKK